MDYSGRRILFNLAVNVVNSLLEQAKAHSIKQIRTSSLIYNFIEKMNDGRRYLDIIFQSVRDKSGIRYCFPFSLRWVGRENHSEKAERFLTFPMLQTIVNEGPMILAKISGKDIQFDGFVEVILDKDRQLSETLFIVRYS